MAQTLAVSSDLVAQLLQGSNPRCFWSPHARKANVAFNAHFPEDYEPPKGCEQADVAGFRCTFTSLDVEGTAGIFIDGVPLGGAPGDRRLAILPDLLQCVMKPDIAGGDVQRFMDMLLEADRSLFTGVLLLVSVDRRSFVLVREIGARPFAMHGWMRWPLARLFTARHACVITNPSQKGRALAVPLNLPSGERYVIIATLRAEPLEAAQHAFLRVLESVVFGEIDSRGPLRAYGLDRVKVEPAGAPHILWYGSEGDAYRRVSALASARGWRVKQTPTLRSAMQLAKRRAADVAVVNGTLLPDPLAPLRALRRAGSTFNMPLVYVGSKGSTAEIKALVDGCVEENAPRSQLFTALKDAIKLVPARRSQALRAAVASFGRRFETCADFDELARLIASAAVSIVGDWAAVAIVDHFGTPYRAEFPRRAMPLLHKIPAAFLSGYAVIQSRIDDEFFEDVLDDEGAARRLLMLRPLSGASMPLIDSARITGTLLVLSTERPIMSPEADALYDLADAASHSFVDLQKRILHAYPAAGERSLWRHLLLSDVRVQAYRGSAASATACIGRIDDTRAVSILLDAQDAARSFELGQRAVHDLVASARKDGDGLEVVDALVCAYESKSDRILAAVTSACGEVTYSAIGHPAPVQIPKRGPAPVLGTHSERIHGTMHVKPGSTALFYSADLSRCIASAQIVATLQRELRRGAANPAEILPELAASPAPLAFIAITSNSSSFARPGRI